MSNLIPGIQNFKHATLQLDTSGLDIPKGFDYRWIREYLLGTKDEERLASAKKEGYQEVPASRHPDFKSEDDSGGCIRRGGLLLCERPIPKIVDCVETAFLNHPASEERLKAYLAD